MKWISRFWEEQKWLDGVSDIIEKQSDRLLKQLPERQSVTDFLHGTWLGHPVHPIVTDVPLGAWTAATVIDLVPTRNGRPHAASTAAVAVGVAGAAAAAVPGIIDWRHLDGQTRRIGTAHALLNSLALTCYIGSLVCRLVRHGPARRLSFMGYGIGLMSGYLGGHLVFDREAGVKRTAGQEAPEEFVPVIAESGLLEGRLQRVDASGYPVLLLRRGDRIYAVADTCTHLGCSLSGGKLDGERVTCPCHGSEFSLDDGRLHSGPAVYPLAAFETRVQGGQIEVRRRPQKPPPAEKAQEAIARVLSSVGGER